MKRLLTLTTALALSLAATGCATSTGLDGALVWREGKAFVVRSYGPIHLVDRLPDADALAPRSGSR